MTYNQILTLNDWSMVNTQTNYTLRLIAVFWFIEIFHFPGRLSLFIFLQWMNGNKVTIVYTLFIGQMITIYDLESRFPIQPLVWGLPLV